LVGEDAQQRLEALTRSTVGITVLKRRKDLSDVLSPRDFQRARRYLSGFTGRRKSWSTAFPLGKTGIFVTSARAIAQAEQVTLRTAGNLEYPARVLGADPASGIGVLEAEVPGTAPLIQSRRDLSLPEDLYVVCYPVDSDEELVRYLPVSLHRGQATASGQSGTYLVSLENLVRTNHSPPQGCPGGPLIDLHGEVAGMILGSLDTGIAFGVPIGDIHGVVDTLSKGAVPERPYFGIGLVAVDERRRARFRIEGTAAHPLVGFLIPGSPAEQSGVRPGDLLAAVEGEKVATISEAMSRLLRATPSGTAVTLTLLRGGQEIGVGVPPGRRPERILLDPVDELQESLEANLTEITTGPTAQQGIKLTDLVRGGRGEKDDYKSGDMITAVEGKGVRRLATFRSVVRSAKAHVFGEGTDGGGREFLTYFLSLDIRSADGERGHRTYFNLFPESLAPPVY
jgi:serine protease Do